MARARYGGCLHAGRPGRLGSTLNPTNPFATVGRIIGVDPVTGARSIVSANDMPAGQPALVEPALMAFEADGDLLVPDLLANQLVRIAPDGSRTVVSSKPSARVHRSTVRLRSSWKATAASS